MGGISGGELVVLLLVGFLVVGPEKLPELSRQLARVVRRVVAVARDTGDKVRAELGDDLADLKDLDPRQYDPRRIVADAMRDPARPTRTAQGAARGPGGNAAWSARRPGAASAAAATAVATSHQDPTNAAGPAARSAEGSAGGATHGTPAVAGDPGARSAPAVTDGTVPAPFDPDAT